MATATATVQVKDVTLVLEAEEAGQVYALLAAFVGGKAAGFGTELGNVRDALRDAGVVRSDRLCRDLAASKDHGYAVLNYGW